MYELKINGLLTLFIRMVWASFLSSSFASSGKFNTSLTLITYNLLILKSYNTYNNKYSEGVPHLS